MQMIQGICYFQVYDYVLVHLLCVGHSRKDEICNWVLSSPCLVINATRAESHMRQKDILRGELLIVQLTSANTMLMKFNFN